MHTSSKVSVMLSWLLLLLLLCWYSCQSAKLQWMWCTTRGEKGRWVSIRYNADSNLLLILKVLRFIRQAVNYNVLTQSRAVCFPGPLVPSGVFCAFVHVFVCVCLLLREGKDAKVKDWHEKKRFLDYRQQREECWRWRHRCFESISCLFIADKKAKVPWSTFQLHLST